MYSSSLCMCRSKSVIVRMSHWECLTRRVEQWFVNGYIMVFLVVHDLTNVWWWQWHAVPRVSRVSLKEFGCPFGCDNGVNKNSPRHWLCHMLNLTPPVFSNIRGHLFFLKGTRGRRETAFFFLNVTFVVVHFFEYHICSSWYSPIHKHPAGPETAPIKRTFFQKNGDFTTVPCWFDDWKSWKDLGRVFWLFSVIAATHAPLSAGSQHSCECISIAKL